jgi:uncharacterized protein (TIGR02444 family)
MTDGSPFWRFSLRTYRVPGVSEAFLELQDSAGADVNFLLYLLWLALNGRRLEDAEIVEAMGDVAAWRNDVVVPLRNVRRFLREIPAGFDANATTRLRADIKRAELESERLQQDAFYRRRWLEELGAAAEPAEAAISNVRAYERVLAAHFPEAARDCVMRAALADISRGTTN